MNSDLQRSLFFENDALGMPALEPAATASPAQPTNNTREPKDLAPGNGTHWAACPQQEDCEWVSFLRINGRVPLISDEKKPWEYRGWLMYYRILLEDHLDIPRRWDYWFRTNEAGHLLDEPIPQIHFGGGETGERSEGYKLIDQWVHLVDRHGAGWSSPMTVLLDWLLWGFGLSAEMPVLPGPLNEHLYREVNLGPLLLKPCDYLEEWIALQKGRWNPNALYPTPHEAVELMVQLNLGAGTDWKTARSLTICDPCMGSGRMLLHSSSYSLRLYGMDIDRQVLRAAKVNGALYCPWLVRPFPESFFAGENAALFLNETSSNGQNNCSVLGTAI